MLFKVVAPFFFFFNEHATRMTCIISFTKRHHTQLLAPYTPCAANSNLSDPIRKRFHCFNTKTIVKSPSYSPQYVLFSIQHFPYIGKCMAIVECFIGEGTCNEPIFVCLSIVNDYYLKNELTYSLRDEN